MRHFNSRPPSVTHYDHYHEDFHDVYDDNDDYCHALCDNNHHNVDEYSLDFNDDY